MSERKDDSGPAFPPNAGWRDNDADCRGISRREWFASNATDGDVAGFLSFGDSPTCGADRIVARYRFADAMIAEGAK